MLVTMREASQRLGVTTRELLDLIDRGEVRAYRYGRTIRVEVDDGEDPVGVPAG